MEHQNDTENNAPLVLVVHASVGSGHKSAANAIAKALELIRHEANAMEDLLLPEGSDTGCACGEDGAHELPQTLQTPSTSSISHSNGEATRTSDASDTPADTSSEALPIKADREALQDVVSDLGINACEFEVAKNLEVEVLDILDFGRIVFNGDNTASMFTGATRPIYDLTWRYTFTGRLLWGGGTIWARIMYPKFVEYVREKKPIAIVATHITAANVAVSARMLLKERFPIICVPTDYEVEGLWPHLYTDLFCVANNYMSETLIPRKVPEERVVVTGIPASPDFSGTYDRDETRKKFGLPLDKQQVLFLAGASLPRPYVHFRNSINTLIPYMHTYTNMHMVIVAGKDAEYAKYLRRRVKDFGLTNVTVLDYVTEMAALMSSSDLIVCKSGGLTVTECLCAGVPMILLGRAYGQEKANVSMLTGAGAALHVTTSGELISLLHQINEHPQMTKATLINATFLRRPNAALDIAKETLRLACVAKDEANPLYRKHFLHFYWGKKPAHIR